MPTSPVPRTASLPRRSARRGLLAAMLLLLATGAAAQSGRGRGCAQRVRRGMPDVRGNFAFCRLMYTQVATDPSGSGWSIEYPRAERILLTRLTQLTLATTSRWKDGTPGYTVIRATDPELFRDRKSTRL